MNSRLALSIAPLLMFALGQQAFAASDTIVAGHHAPGRVAINRHGKTRLAAERSRHGRYIGVHHLAVRHVEGRHVVSRGPAARPAAARSYGVAETDGWNPAEADISPPPAPGAAARQLASVAPPAAPAEVGVASYYAERYDGRRTSSGTVFHEQAMTAASNRLPFGTKVLVQVQGTDRAVVVTITDRLAAPHRIIDLSRGAAERLGIIRDGLAMVMLTPQD